MPAYETRFCPHCATPLALLVEEEDGGPKQRMRCPACAWTHWNNPTPVLAAIVECVDRGGQILLARNAAWPGRMFALITGFMEAGESPEEGVAREVGEETSLEVLATSLVGVYEFRRMNQLIVAYHVQARGEVRLSAELAEYKMFAPPDVRCWPAGTGMAMADWLRSRGHEPVFMSAPKPVGPAADRS
jgi:NAD+ diphosphatase